MHAIKPMQFMSKLKVAMITHYQSSGSLYLHSLLDGHPQIITIPGVPHLDPIINGTFDTSQQALDVFNIANPKFYDTSKMTFADLNSSGLYRLGENANEGIVTDKILFNQFFFECIHKENLVPRNIIFSLYYAYAKSHGMDLNTKKVVLFHPHEIHRTISMHNLFPDSKYLVTIRNPARAYYSRLQLMKNKAKARNIAHSHLGLLSDDAYNVYELLQNNMSMRIVKIEDFAENSHYILMKLCKYLNIDYNAELQKSTFGSKLYWGANSNYKSNTFTKTRHVKKLPLKRHELLLFSIINKKLNQITGYSNMQISWFKKKLSVLWFILPFTADIEWVKKAFYYNEYKGLRDYSGQYPSRIIMTLKLIKERITLLKIYFFNIHTTENYNRIKKCLISSNN